MARRVAIIGAGLGGLSAAIRLAAHGGQVDVFEQQDSTGGKAGSLHLGEYRFDTGPSLFTMPEVFSQLWAEAGSAMSDDLGIAKLETLCRYFYPDGTRISSHTDRRAFAQEIAEKTTDSGESLYRFLDYSHRIHRAAGHLFLWKSLHDPRSYLSGQAAGSVLRLGQIDALRTMDAANQSFFNDPRMLQLFNRYATYNGSSPYRVPATLNIIPHVEYDRGAYAVEGGIQAVPRAMTGLAARVGVRLHTGARVDHIFQTGKGRNREVRGLVVDGKEIEYDALVSNVDVKATYGNLLQDRDDSLFRRYQRLEPSSSGLVYYFGMKESFPEFGLHNIFFSADYPGEFAAIFDQGRCSDDPTVYLNITSKVTAADAPVGGENWFILVNAPANSGQDWPGAAETTRDRVLAKIEGGLGRPVRQAIVTESVMTPVDIEANTGSSQGSLYGISSNSRLAAFLRHPNWSPRYRGLYFCGGSVHPGGGMPLAVLSGKIAADMLRRRERWS